MALKGPAAGAADRAEAQAPTSAGAMRAGAARRWPMPWQAGLAAAGLAGLWGVARALPAPGGHAHEAASALAALGVGAAVLGTPCVLQMSAVCLALLAGAPLDDLAEGVRRAGRAPLLGRLARFAAGYTGVLVGAGAALALLARAVGPGPLGPVLHVVGVTTLALLGLALLGVLPLPGRPCAGPFRFLRRAALLPPGALGRAFALYCAACCGPMLVPLAALGSPSPGRAAALGATFAAGVSVPFLVAVASAAWAVRLARFLADHAAGWQRACGAALLAMAFLAAVAGP